MQGHIAWHPLPESHSLRPVWSGVESTAGASRIAQYGCTRIVPHGRSLTTGGIFIYATVPGLGSVLCAMPARLPTVADENAVLPVVRFPIPSFLPLTPSRSPPHARPQDFEPEIDQGKNLSQRLYLPRSASANLRKSPGGCLHFLHFSHGGIWRV
ncbi:hypothetical protein BDV09DRAFT_166849 [Aspergillus tetrazonus]